ncbi:hypothetical protein LTS18_006788 [Coniosporium uncinatum]|uniref:Uncharacterized protein n=1 Tax=Coniosporium uncinatum TaxID=93489 RepID=A0ACC3DPR8_9PEZI|nr:hypothetical protein LTS18_006788 [Coniosporium uncinatum]
MIERGPNGAIILVGPKIRGQNDVTSPYGGYADLEETVPMLCQACQEEFLRHSQDVNNNALETFMRGFVDALQDTDSPGRKAEMFPSVSPEPVQPRDERKSTTQMSNASSNESTSPRTTDQHDRSHMRTEDLRSASRHSAVPSRAPSIATVGVDSMSGGIATDILQIIDTILDEHRNTINNVIANLQHAEPSLEQIRRLLVELIQVQLAREGERFIPPAPTPSRDIREANDRSAPSLDDPPALLRRRTRSVPDLLQLVETAAEELGVQLPESIAKTPESARRPIMSIERRITQPPKALTPAIQVWSPPLAPAPTPAHGDDFSRSGTPSPPEQRDRPVTSVYPNGGFFPSEASHPSWNPKTSVASLPREPESAAHQQLASSTMSIAGSEPPNVQRNASHATDPFSDFSDVFSETLRRETMGLPSPPPPSQPVVPPTPAFEELPGMFPPSPMILPQHDSDSPHESVESGRSQVYTVMPAKFDAPRSQFDGTPRTFTPDARDETGSMSPFPSYHDDSFNPSRTSLPQTVASPSFPIDDAKPLIRYVEENGEVVMWSAGLNTVASMARVTKPPWTLPESEIIRRPPAIPAFQRGWGSHPHVKVPKHETQEVQGSVDDLTTVAAMEANRRLTPPNNQVGL